jgi:hypothetical protein
LPKFASAFQGGIRRSAVISAMKSARFEASS